MSASGPKHHTQGTSSRLAGLDGLRGILATCVILVHTTELLAPNILGVTRIGVLGYVIVVFFVMSGFIISLPFVSRLIDGRTMPSVKDYAQNRLLRVFPAYLVIFVVADFVFQAVYVANAAETSASRSDQGTGVIAAPGQVLLQLSLLQNYLPGGLQTGINPAWTLTVELAFYFSLPLVMLAVFALRDRSRWSGLALAVLPPALFLLVGVVCRALAGIFAAAQPQLSVEQAEWGANWLAVFSRSIFLWSDNFALGIAAAVVFVAAKRGLLVKRRFVQLRALVALVLTASILASVVAFLLQSRYFATGVAVASAAAILMLTLPTKRNRVSALAVALDWLPFRYMGTISLSAYLWHYPVLVVFTRLGLIGPDSFPGALWNFAVVLASSVALASVTYHLVELPALRFGRNRKPIPSTATVAVGVAGTTAD